MRYRSFTSRFLINLNAHPRSTLLLGGSARSGTTWIADLINHDNRFRFMFEPFSRAHVEICRDFNIRQYLRPNCEHSTFYGIAERIISGRIRSEWIDRYNKRFACRQRLIKDIRANLMLKWLHTRFPETRIVFLMRHPCAVALSRVRLGWETHLDEVLTQDDLVTDFLSNHVDEIGSSESAFEKQIYLWCIENLVPLRQFQRGEILVVFYEDLCRQPESVLPRLYRWLGLQFDESTLTKSRKPSPMARKDSAVNTGSDLVGNWRTKIETKEVDRASKILERFSLDTVYSADLLPRTSDPLSLP